MTAIAPDVGHHRGTRLAEFAALGTSVYWASGYILNQRATEDLTPAALTFFLFATCALLSIPMAIRELRRSPKQAAERPDRAGLVRSGAILGTCTGIGYLASTIGLQYTSTSKVAFIIGMAAVVVPIIELVVYRKRTPGSVVFAIGIAICGLYLLTNAGMGLNVGDVITLVTPVSYACWTVAANRFAHRYPVFALNGIGFAVTALIALPSCIVSGVGSVSTYALAFVVGMAVTEILITALCVWVAGRISPARYGLLHLAEPVIAATIGFMVGERIGAVGVVGALLILVALLVVEVIGEEAAPEPEVRFVRTEAERAAWEANRYRVRRWELEVVSPPSPPMMPLPAAAPERRKRIRATSTSNS